MNEIPVALVVGTIMIFLGTAVAVWIAVSIVSQNRKDQSYPE
jgi:hypothetical protein